MSAEVHQKVEVLRSANFWHWLAHAIEVVYVLIITNFKNRAESGLWKRYHTKTDPQSLKTDLEDYMSDATVFFHDLVSVFEKVENATPAGQQSQITTAKTAVSNAASAVESALPALAVGIANIALAAIPGGPGFEGMADTVLELVIAELQSALAKSASSTSTTTTTAVTTSTLGVAGL
jgi:hypothetical protein